MAKPMDPDRWARDLIDLWQDQISALAGDPAVLAFWSKALCQTMPHQGEADHDQLSEQWIAALAAALQSAGQETVAGPRDDVPGDAPGTAPAAAASDDGADLLERLARRVDALEERLAAERAKPQAPC